MERKALEGIQVLVTRPRERSQELCFLLEEEGAEVTALPLLELTPPDDLRPLQAAVEHLAHYRWVVLASPSAAQALVEAAREAGTLNALSEVKLAAVGPATARAAVALGLKVSHEAASGTSMGLLEEIRATTKAGDAVLLPAAQDGRRELFEALLAESIAAVWVPAYRSAARALSPEELEAIDFSAVRVVIFGSPRTAEAFLEATLDSGRALLTRAKVVTIGPTTAAALDAMGLPGAFVAAHPTAAELVEATVRAVRG